MIAPSGTNSAGKQTGIDCVVCIHIDSKLCAIGLTFAMLLRL